MATISCPAILIFAPIFGLAQAAAETCSLTLGLSGRGRPGDSLLLEQKVHCPMPRSS
jgi:hypothetical protein